MTTRKERAEKRRQQRKINTILFVAGGLLVVAAAALLLSGRPSTQAVGPARIGQPLADFSLTDIHGDTVRLSDYAGRVVLINAWATWCPPCKAEMPDLQSYYKQRQSEGLVLLAVNAGENASQVGQFIQMQGFTFPVLLDPGVATLNSLGIGSFPTTILVGRDGVVKTIHVGMFTPQSLEAEITPFLAE